MSINNQWRGLPPDVRELFEAANFAHIATVDSDGSPFAAIVWVTVIDGHAAFFTSPATQHGRNLERDPRVAISIAAEGNPYSIARVRGRVARRIEGDAALPIIDMMADKYLSQPYPRPVPPNSFICVVEPVSMKREDHPYVYRPRVVSH